ncbi:TVP38/TMEM64 family protein [Bacillus tuaregi]|uniref:TVP38/TMEM64 family protein n=1 Tax=Bacillus tuaregi TaxID=1816695 RepID=UPI0008F8FE92|nr:VTT domain-containing protein [Bacillus tuaregi]
MKKVVHIKNWIKSLSFLLLVSIMIYFIFHAEWFQAFRSGDIGGIIQENLWITLLITLLVMIIQNTFTIIPLILIITINYTVFGFMNGFLWSWLSSIAGAALMFFGSRYLFQDWVLPRINKEFIDKIEKKGFLFVFQARIMPFIPTSLINILGGISSIRFNSFITATIFGNFIYFFILTLIPAGLMNSQINEFLIEAFILIAIILMILYKRKRKKGEKRTLSNHSKGM